MRLATWNVNSLGARLPYVVEWIEANSPDVLCLQETKLADEAFPMAAFADLGYDVAHHGEGRWNGVAIASRVGLADPSRGFEADEDVHGSRIVAATCGGIRVHSVYVPNGRSLEDEQYGFKLAWLARLATYLADRCSPNDEVAVCGDFNVAPEDRDVWDPAATSGGTHVSEPERRALRTLVDWGLEDVFRRHVPEGSVFSWWDYRAGDFHQGRGMRIDLVLLSAAPARRTTAVYIDRNARKKSPGANKPSDHAPVVVDLADH
ncbi:MAG TPA: exodeoxyribonuclease III [Acidimicrobiales bacterium]|nr:exodeoxyribonuclease III [Acidimicrobiales bacterium]